MNDTCQPSPDKQHKYECKSAVYSEVYTCIWCGDYYRIHEDEIR